MKKALLALTLLAFTAAFAAPLLMAEPAVAHDCPSGTTHSDTSDTCIRGGGGGRGSHG